MPKALAQAMMLDATESHAIKVVLYWQLWNLSGMRRRHLPILRSIASLLRRQRPFLVTPLYVDFYDPDHSNDEYRYIIIGESQQGRLLLVSYTERDKATCLISAREVTRGEREAYEEG